MRGDALTDCEQSELDGMMAVTLPVEVALDGGSVLVEVAGGTIGVRLTRLVTDLIESREGRFGRIDPSDLAYLAEVRREMALATSLMEGRISLERARQGLLEGA